MQKIKKSGLPGEVKMRHDVHFVDMITSRAAGPTIRMIPLNKIEPNPHQARTELGNINELMASIKEKGVLEPILVRPKGNKYEIIAGERRYIASKRIGMKEISCIEMDVTDNEAMELSLIENLQRKDLDVFEEADGLKSLAEIYGYNHAEIAEKIGKARSTITEIINVGNIPREIRELCDKYEIKSRTTLIEVSKQKNKEHMLKLIKAIGERDLKREDTRELSKRIKGRETEGIKRFVYNYGPKKDKTWKLRIVFKKQSVEKEEIIKILEEIIKKLKE